MKATLPLTRSLIGRLFCRIGITIVALGFFTVRPQAQALNPSPDGGYLGGNTAEGQSALSSLTTGGFNAAVGYFSLFSNFTGSFNTAVGAGALDLNAADDNTATGAAALLLNTIGADNTATGVDALVHNDTGSRTRPLEHSFFLAIRKPATTRLSGLPRSFPTLPVPTTPPSGTRRVGPKTPAAATSILAQEWLARLAKVTLAISGASLAKPQ